MAAFWGLSLAGFLIVSTFGTSALMDKSRSQMRNSAKMAVFNQRTEVDWLCEETPYPILLSQGDIIHFKSPTKHRKYPRNTDCGLILTGTTNSTKFVINCSEFRMQRPQDGTCKDYLSLNGEQFCGTYGQRPIGWASEGSSVAINFHSDGKWNKKGFSCSATVVSVSSDDGQPSGDSTSCNCGVPNKMTRVIGGAPTEKNVYPWQVAIAWPGNNDFQDFYCGGSIINRRWVLTAAHCGVVSEDQVIVGAHSWLSPLTSGHRLDIESVIIHDQYNSETKDNDIALLRLAEDLNFDDKKVAAVCLPVPGLSKTYAGYKATVTGWGSLKYETPLFPSELHEVEIDVVNNSLCRKGYDKYYTITDNMMCAGSQEGGKDTCQGDSGGPLVIETNGIFTQIGITSWGIGCGSSEYFGVYTRVTRYVEWIAFKVDSDGICHQLMN